MRIAPMACVAMVAVLLAPPAVAEQQPASIDEATIDTRILPVSLDRIRRRMAALPADEDRLLLRLTTRINVYARAQAVEVLEGFNVESWTSLLGGRTGGAIAYGSPTHNETVNAMTPEFWRQRASSLAGIGVGW
ncbi:MAG: hypothetical protein J4G16_06855 [Acidobacteria bacterium]|nr:hypothetical protein [Acidobacteriota bacterium]